MLDLWVTIVCSVGGAILGTLIGGFFTLLDDKRKQSHQDLKDKKAHLQKEYELRPCLELKKFKDL